jgi:hypothetical protein
MLGGDCGAPATPTPLRSFFVSIHSKRLTRGYFVSIDSKEVRKWKLENGRCEAAYTPAFSVKSAQAIENNRDGFRSFERERKSATERAVRAPLAEFARGKKECGKSLADRGKSVEVKENRGVMI